MTKVIKVYEPTENTKRILELGADLSSLLKTTKENQHLCVDLAVKIGALLVAERNKVTKEMGRGYWVSYYNITFGKLIPERTAYRYMKLAIASGKNGKEGLADDYNSEIRHDESFPNLLRDGILALGMLPNKDAPNTPTDKPAPRPTSHLSFITRFKAWLPWWRKQNNRNEPNAEQMVQLAEDFEPVIEFLESIGLIARK